MVFHKLTPRDDISIDTYKEALDFAFAHGDLKNIAITGSYGSGKSSVLRSYQKHRDDLTFVHVSLARFGNDPGECDDVNQSVSKQNGEEREGGTIGNESSREPLTGNSELRSPTHTLEAKVINQLIHSIGASKTPQTRFAVRRDLPVGRSLIIALFVILLALLPVYITGFSSWTSLVRTSSVPFKSFLLNDFRIPTGIVWIAMVTLGLVYLVKHLNGKQILAKVTFKGNNIELFEEKHDSPFDKHLDELLYTIEKSGVDAFVFEDIDRYQIAEIFTRLREINRLVNLRLYHKESNHAWRNWLKRRFPLLPLDLGVKTVRFLYALRDDLFSSSERTKFFDFIIPIVPIVVATNSFKHLQEMLIESDLEKGLDEYFLKEISRYLDDMRVLKNIVNEYAIYIHRLGNENLDRNKLFGAIVFKNIHPCTFVELQQGVGTVYNLFNTEKNRLIADEKARVAGRMSVINKQIKALSGEAEVASTSTTLRTSAVEDEDDSEDEVASLMSKKDELQREKRLIDTKKLKDLLGSVGDDNVLEELDNQPLTKFLIREGYLDEYYPDYISYVLEHLGDHTFLRSVTDRRPRPFTYELHDPKHIMDALRPEHFEYPSTLNNDLLDYILQNECAEPSYAEQLSYVVSQLQREQNFAFVAQYLQLGKERYSFIKAINSLWEGIWSDILQSSELTPQELQNYVADSLMYSEPNDVLSMNFDGLLTEYISTNENFLKIEHLDEGKVERVTSMLTDLGVKFSQVNFKVSDVDLFRAVYIANLYSINQSMVFLILKEMYCIPQGDSYKHRNYTLVSSLPEQPLFKYVNSNINGYMDLVFDICEGRITDSEDVAVAVLNHVDVTLENKKKYLSYLDTSIEKLSSVTGKELWPTMLSADVVAYSDDNVLTYYFDYSESLAEPFDEELVAYMNSFESAPQVTVGEIEDRYGSERRSKWLRALFSCNGLKDSVYDQWMTSLNFQFDLFALEEIEDSKIKVLLDHNAIKMSREDFLFMREHYGDHMHAYIYPNIDVFVKEVLEDVPFDPDEFLPLLTEDIDDDYKIAILEQTAESIPIEDKEYTAKVQLHILQNNFDDVDIPWLIRQFSEIDASVHDTILGVLRDRIDDVTSNGYSIPFPLLLRLLQIDIDIEHKHGLLANSLAELDVHQAAECMEKAGLGVLIRALRGGNPKVPMSNAIKEILKVSKSKLWISKYKKDDREANRYRVIGFTRRHPLPRE